jgi:hypothetical protein
MGYGCINNVDKRRRGMFCMEPDSRRGGFVLLAYITFWCSCFESVWWSKGSVKVPKGMGAPMLHRSGHDALKSCTAFSEG